MDRTKMGILAGFAVILVVVAGAILISRGGGDDDSGGTTAQISDTKPEIGSRTVPRRPRSRPGT